MSVVTPFLHSLLISVFCLYLFLLLNQSLDCIWRMQHPPRFENMRATYRTTLCRVCRLVIFYRTKVLYLTLYVFISDLRCSGYYPVIDNE